MKKLRGILSIILAVALLCSTFCFAGTANAATVDTESTATDVNLQDNVQDGVILHAFCWSYAEIEKNLEAIKAAGYSTIQTSPVQQPKDYSSSTDIAGQWWKLYQPVSLSIADNTWLGTKEDLKSLCTAAHKYGIKIICDIVSNHLAASNDSATYYKLADEVKTYEPTIYGSSGGTQNNQYFHQLWQTAGDSSVQSTVQGLVSACPDLNTGNSYVQQRVTSLLKECVDVGVDGFRFDAAKHIETSSDGSYASSYWNTVLGNATSYAKSTQNKDLYYYGEVLNTFGSGRNASAYTSMMSVTDNVTGNAVLSNVKNGNASAAANSNYQLTGNASKSVLWAESHDTYEGSSGSTQDVSDSDIVKAWAIVASRKDATALYFARPGSMSMGGCATDTTYKSVAVAEVNKFHNNFVGQSEKLGSSGNIAYVARGTSGIILVNTKGTTASASISGTGLANGNYTDMVTGSKFTVSNGTVSGQIGSTGVAVVTQGTTTPKAFASQETQTFEGESITVQLSLSNATSGTYQLENYAPVSFTGSPTIRIGKDYNYGDTIKLTLTATDGTQTTTATYLYTKKAAASSGVYVILPASVVSSKSWKAPIKCYVYDEVTNKKITYKNAAWPGEQMQYDSTLDCYYIQVNNNSCLQQASGSDTTSASTFDLASSSNTCVIVNDSSSTNGATSAGKQFPSASSSTTLKLGGTSHKLTSMAAAGWVTTTDKPGSSNVNVSATEVTKGSATVATTVTTAPTTAAPTTEAPTTTAPTTTEAPTTTAPTTVAPTTEAPTTEAPTTVAPTTEAPTTVAPATTAPTTVASTIEAPVLDPNKLYYGDTNLDGKIDITDVTSIQKHLADISILSGDSLNVSDVNGDGRITIKDATFIQKFSLLMSDHAKVGEVYATKATQPTETQTEEETEAPTTTYPPTEAPTTEAPATTAPTTVAPTTEAPTQPAESTYTAYFKTSLSWMTSMGCNVYLYDNASGTSYLMEQDTSAYPNVFTAEVPDSCSSVTFYRALTPVDDPNSGTGAYNLMPATLSKSDNCYTLTDYPEGGSPEGSTGPYVEEQAPSFQLSTVYFDNSATKWSSVYVYGWGYGINQETIEMTQIAGTDIWVAELPQAIPDGVKTFLFKETKGTGSTDWNNKTGDVTVQEPYNCYVGGSNTWTTYNG
jgi:alpha-amylase